MSLGGKRVRRRLLQDGSTIGLHDAVRLQALDAGIKPCVSATTTIFLTSTSLQPPSLVRCRCRRRAFLMSHGHGRFLSFCLLSSFTTTNLRWLSGFLRAGWMCQHTLTSTFCTSHLPLHAAHFTALSHFTTYLGIRYTSSLLPVTVYFDLSLACLLDQDAGRTGQRYPLP